MLSNLSRCSVRSCEDIMDQPDVLLGPKPKSGPFPGPPGPAPGPLPGPWAIEIFEAKNNAAAAAIRTFFIIISCGSRLCCKGYVEIIHGTSAGEVVTDQLDQALDLHRPAGVRLAVHEIQPAAAAGHHHGFGAGRLDLPLLQLERLLAQAGRAVDEEHARAAAAAPVHLGVRIGLAEIHAERAQRLARFAEHAAVAAELAGIVIGELARSGVSQLQAPGPDFPADELGDGEHLERQRLARHRRALPAKRRIRVAA